MPVGSGTYHQQQRECAYDTCCSITADRFVWCMPCVLYIVLLPGTVLLILLLSRLLPPMAYVWKTKSGCHFRIRNWAPIFGWVSTLKRNPKMEIHQFRVYKICTPILCEPKRPFLDPEPSASGLPGIRFANRFLANRKRSFSDPEAVLKEMEGPAIILTFGPRHRPNTYDCKRLQTADRRRAFYEGWCPNFSTSREPPHTQYHCLVVEHSERKAVLLV